MKKWLILALYVLIFITAWAYRNDIVEYMHNHTSFPLLITLATLLALFPIVPYKLVIAALGYTYGTVWAASISWLGTMLAASIIYALARYVLQERARKYLARIQSLDFVISWMERHPFTSIAASRLIPVVPQMAVNVVAGVASIRFWTYTAASGVGKLPGIFLYAFLGGHLKTNPVASTAVIGGYVLVIGLLIVIYRRKRRV